MHAHTIHIITQCNQIVNSKIIKCSFSEGKKLKVTKMLSYPEHITTCISTQQRECSPTHPKGIQKSLQNTSPRGVNAAVKSVIRLLVHLKSRTPPPSIFPSGVTPIWRGCAVTSLWTNQKQV